MVKFWKIELNLKSEIFRYGETTAVGGGITEGASQMNTNDNVSDMMIVITDGFDGDLTALQEWFFLYINE